jgi:hypothetical protein
MSPSSAAIVLASTQLIPGTAQSKRHVAVVGAEPEELAPALADLPLERVNRTPASSMPYQGSGSPSWASSWRRAPRTDRRPDGACRG